MTGGHVLLCKSLSPLSHHGLGLLLAAPPVTASAFLIRQTDLGPLPGSQGRVPYGVFPRPFLHPSGFCHQDSIARETWTSYHLCIHHPLHSSVTGRHSFSQVGHVLFIPLLSIESHHLSGLENSGCHHSELGFSKNNNNHSEAQLTVPTTCGHFKDTYLIITAWRKMYHYCFHFTNETMGPQRG